VDLALRENVNPRVRVARERRRCHMRIIAVGSICNGEIGEGINADVLQAKMLELGSGTVMIDRERTLRQESDGLCDCRLA
jgi:hypothetical protein